MCNSRIRRLRSGGRRKRLARAGHPASHKQCHQPEANSAKKRLTAGRPKSFATLRELSRAHAAEAIEELARLAMHAKSESARIAAIREVLDRAFGRPTQFLAADDDAIPENLSLDELRAQIFAEVEQATGRLRDG